MFFLFFLCSTILEINDLIKRSIDDISENIIDAEIPKETKLLNVDFSESRETLKTVKFLGTNVIRIKDVCFKNCTLLEKINLEVCKNLISIPLKCFEFCSSLKSINLPPCLKTISSYSFGYCSSLSFVNLTFDHKTMFIQSYAFIGCGFSEFVIPDTLSYLSELCLAACKSLREVKIRNNHNFYKRDGMIFSFEYCQLIFVPYTTLGEVFEIPSYVQVIGPGLFHSSDVKEFIFPKTLNSIEFMAFVYCNSLKKINISDTEVVWLGHDAFANCDALETVVLPEQYCYTNRNMLKNCKSLKYVQFPRHNMRISVDTFDDTPGLVQVNCTQRLMLQMIDLGFDRKIFNPFKELLVRINSMNKTKDYDLMYTYHMLKLNDFEDKSREIIDLLFDTRKKNTEKRAKMMREH